MIDVINDIFMLLLLGVAFGIFLLAIE